MHTIPKLKAEDKSCPIVALEHFVLATREVGYRSTAAAIAELIDNAVQARAKNIRIFVSDNRGDATVAVLDDGCGMNNQSLRTALQFGGTNRFDDRSGLGRFGMGLPCSSMSQARRLEVYSWVKSAEVNYSYLDVDEISSGTIREIPLPMRTEMPNEARPFSSKSGTLVVWRRCDKIETNKLSVLTNELRTHIGRLFRYFIWDGLKITVNAQPVGPVDPLFCHCQTPLTGGRDYGAPLLYKVRIPREAQSPSTVRVRFSELPIAEWRELSNQDKRRLGIVKGAGVSLVRAGREIAYGWYFMGEKRKENYDDWWRCEIAFEPQLDEYFRPTHTKQEIHPTPELEAILTPDVEAIARTLNARVRSAFSSLKSGISKSTANLVSERDGYLPPLPGDGATTPCSQRNCPASAIPVEFLGRYKYTFSVESQRDEAFYSFQRDNGSLALKLNKDHPFFERIYSPLCERAARQIRSNIDCLLFALIRAEAEAKSAEQRYWYNRKRTAWSNILATFLGS